MSAADEPERDDPEAEAPLPANCRTVQMLTAKFVHSTLSRAEDAFFRAHLDKCDRCEVVYRRAVHSAARLGRSMRAERGDAERERRHAEFEERARNATAGGKRKNRFGLRLALMPAGIALAFLLFRGGGGTQSLEVVWTGGDVRVSGQRLGTDLPRMRLSRGDIVETRGNAHATILDGEGDDDVAYGLGMHTAVGVIDLRRSELRLHKGELTVHRPARVASAQGVLEVRSGSARLALDNALYDLECIEGALAWTGPTGVRELAAGESIESSSVLYDER